MDSTSSAPISTSPLPNVASSVVAVAVNRTSRSQESGRSTNSTASSSCSSSDQARGLERALQQAEGALVAGDPDDRGLAVGAVGHHGDGLRDEDPAEAEHRAPLVDRVPSGLPFGTDDVGVDHAAALGQVVAPRPDALDHELHAIVVDFTSPARPSAEIPAEQRALVGDDAGPDLALAEDLERGRPGRRASGRPRACRPTARRRASTPPGRRSNHPAGRDGLVHPTRRLPLSRRRSAGDRVRPAAAADTVPAGGAVIPILSLLIPFLGTAFAQAPAAPARAGARAGSSPRPTRRRPGP